MGGQVGGALCVGAPLAVVPGRTLSCGVEDGVIKTTTTMYYYYVGRL